jgi:hypothetical protein
MCQGSSEVLKSNSGNLSVAGGALNALGSIMGGNQQKKYADYKAAQSEADANAEAGMGQVRAGKVRKAGALTLADARAAGGGSGVDVNSGSMLSAGETITRNVGSDALTELLTGNRRAASLRATGQGYTAAGTIAQNAGYMGAGRSLLSGSAKAIADKEAQNRYKKTEFTPPPADYSGEDW